MIESLVNAFTRNNFLFSKKADSPGGDFQQTLSKYDKQVEPQHQEKDIFKFEQKSEDRPPEYNRSDEDLNKAEEDHDYREEVKSEQAKGNDIQEQEPVKVEEVEPEESDDTPQENLKPFFSLLEKLGVSKEDLAKIEKLVNGELGDFSKKDLADFLKSLKDALKENSSELPKGLLGKVENFVQKLEQALKADTKPAANIIRDLAGKASANAETLDAEKVKDAGPDKVDRQIKHNNMKHAAMKEIANESANVKFRTEVDPRFAKDGAQKANQALQAKQAQFNVITNSQQGSPQNGAGGENSAENSGQSPNFLKKMKTILKVNNTNNLSNEAVSADSPKAQTSNGVKPSFMTRLSSGSFLQQMVNKIQNMVKGGATLSASVDFKTAEFGEMKLAAEAQGSSLAVKLSNISSSMKADIISLRNELDAELRSLGYENVELDFGDGSNGGDHKNAFEDEMQKRLNEDSVKLPGDHLADLKAIDDFMKNYEKVM